MLKKKQSRKEQRKLCVENNFRYRGQRSLGQDEIGVKTAELRGRLADIRGQSIPGREQKVERNGPECPKKANVVGAK